MRRAVLAVTAVVATVLAAFLLPAQSSVLTAAVPVPACVKPSSNITHLKMVNYEQCLQQRTEALLANAQAPAPTVTETVTATPAPAPTVTETVTVTPSPTPTPDPTPDPTQDPDPAGGVCTNPEWTTSEDGDSYNWQVDPYDPPNGVGFYGQIMVHNNMWNSGGYDVTQTMGACNYDSWYVVAKADNSSGDGAVKTYPNVHIDYIEWGEDWMQPLSDFSALKVRFAHKAPTTPGIWNVAFDVWLNGIGNGDANELMIWTENHNQRPAGSKITTVTLNGHEWEFWSGYDNHYLAFVPTSSTPITADEFDLLAFTDWLKARGHIRADSTIGQLDYGVEIVSTGGVPTRFDFTDFKVTEVAATP